MHALELAVLLGLLALCSGKIVHKTLTFTEDALWQYLTKFGISVGQGHFEVKVRFKMPLPKEDKIQTNASAYKLDINFYLDTKWGAALEETVCKKKSENEIRVENLEIPIDGEWSESKVGGLRQNTRPFVWFLAASDCNQNLHSHNPSMPPIEIFLHFTGSDWGEFSHEEMGLLTLYTISLLLYIVLLGYNIYNYYRDIKKTDKMDSPIMLLLIAVTLEFLSVFFQWLHLLAYSFDGEGMTSCYAISVMAEVASEFILSLLLILLSWGWTITYLEFQEIDLLVPLVILLLVIHLIVAGLTQICNDAYHKYHDFEGIQGLLLVIARIGMFGYFLYGMKDTYQKCRTKAKSFIQHFSYYASAYLISFPLLVVVSQLCAHYVRHKVISIGTIAAQSLAMCVLLRLFIGKTSYTSISKQHDTILPGGKND